MEKFDKDLKNIKKGSEIIPTNKHELVLKSQSLVRRGLELIEDLKQIDVTLTESEILPFIEKFRDIKNSIGNIPDEFLKKKTANPHDILAFDLNDFLLAFDKIRIRNDFVLDYVYDFDGHYGGEPLVYAREKTSSPIESPKKYYEKFLIPRPEILLGNKPNYEDSIPYLSHLEFENTPIGYFQFAIFCMTVRRFYLYWHSNYNDRKFILRKSGLRHFAQNKIGGISPMEVEFLQTVSFAPKLSIVSKLARVSILTFEENIGYSFLHISVRHPNIFHNPEDEVIIKNKVTRLY